MAVVWAMQSRDGLFWRDAEKKHTFVFGSIDGSVPRVSARDVQVGNVRVPKNKEDDIWLNKLVNLGMAPEDEWKIVCLREYIWRMAQSKPRLLSESTHSLLSATISLQELKITPRTIFFDENESFFKRATAGSAPGTPARPLTVADALMDASRTIDKSLKKSASNLHLKRIATDIQRQQRNAESGQNSPVSGSTTPIQTVQSDTSLSSPTPTKSLQIPVVRVNGGSEPPGSPNSVENGVISGLRRQKSSSSLLNRGTPAKATSETSNISAIAVDRAETPTPRDTNNRMVDVVSYEPLFKFRAAHSYDGNDPHILHLLDTMYLQNYPSDIVEFGPAIVPAQRRQPIKKSNGRLAGGYWKPEANFVASFGEHHDSINRVVVAPDHAFFATASDDGTVKIWDTTRLEKNVAFRARQTYKHSNSAKVKALCFVENTRCFVSGATDGSIHVVKVEFSTAAAKYGKLRVMREYQLPGPQEYAVWMEHFKSDNNSILLIATNVSNIHALDLRTMQILYTLKNPIYHGTPTCFCIDKKHNWLVVGTSHGILDMWDLRYQLPLKAWGIPGSMPIHKLQVHPTKGRGRWIIVAGGTGQNELTVWDCDKTQCREVYRASSGGGSSKDWSNPKNYEAWNVGDESPETILSRFATSLSHLDSTAVAGVDRGPRTFLAEQDFVEGDIDTRVVPSFIITGGVDHKVRFWNTVRVEASCVVSGLDVDESKPTYVCLQPAPQFVVYTEKPSHSDTESVTSVGSGGIRGFLGVGGSSTRPSTPSSGGGSSKRKNAVAAAGGEGGRRTSRSTVISQQQQALLKSHLDTVMDVAFLEVPYGMIVSVDRGGMVFLYQ
jgi:phosphoinositide-3-kinase regulatory subunit 4